jgi:hypothetical protein
MLQIPAHHCTYFYNVHILVGSIEAIHSADEEGSDVLRVEMESSALKHPTDLHPPDTRGKLSHLHGDNYLVSGSPYRNPFRQVRNEY